ncbi:HipA domain-containing protein [Herbaspirillum hiltneri]|uniref:HipA domain-containing protein n=1 Tax=Herbaspirillum hiltneri TaxID=341045 RepID=UPI00069D198B|nr:HipA domain-containing protein [Herbaspirillum hiltneri]
MTYKLLAISDSQRIGELFCESLDDLHKFHYSRNWRESPQAFPLSSHMSLSRERIPSYTIRRYLNNLLPEGEALHVAAARNKVSIANTLILALRLGQEPAGAASFVWDADNVVLPNVQKPFRRYISDEELAQRIRTRDKNPFSVWGGRLYQQLAGVQDKLQILVENGEFFLVGGSLSSTHIIKPETRNPKTPFMVANEHFCMSLAAALGLQVASVGIRRTPEPVLLIERFDRSVEYNVHDGQCGAIVRRRHIIDGCQALNMPAEWKYECPKGHTPSRNVPSIGVSFEKLFSLRPYFSVPAQVVKGILQWALLQLLIGNSDAHGKNISFFQTHDGLALAPMYDLVCTQAYGDAVAQEMAMAYGGTFQLVKVDAQQLLKFAGIAGVTARLLGEELARLASAAFVHAKRLAIDSIYTDDERAFLLSVTDFVSSQAKKMLRFAGDIYVHGNPSGVHLGLAKDKFEAPADIDATNSEIGRMFNGDD